MRGEFSTSILACGEHAKMPEGRQKGDDPEFTLFLGAKPAKSIPSGDMRGGWDTTIWMDGESIQMLGERQEGDGCQEKSRFFLT